MKVNPHQLNEKPPLVGARAYNQLLQKNMKTDNGVVIIRASDVNPKSTKWIMRDWLAENEFHIFGGAGGTGKTTVTLSIAAIISSGGELPDGTQCPMAGNVLIWSGEDSIERTLVPRLMAMGANLDKCFFITGFSQDGKKRAFNPSSDFENIDKKIREIGEVCLLIVDPIVTSIKGNMNDSNVVRMGLQPFLDFTEKHNCSIIGITHFGKGTQGRDVTERIIGSQAFTAVARIVWATAMDADGNRVLIHPKNNLGTVNGGFIFQCEQAILEDEIEASKIIWGEAVQGGAKEILETYETPSDSQKTSKAIDAENFLINILNNGSLATGRVYELAAIEGISAATMRRASKSLGIKTTKAGMDEGWYWSLSND